MEGLKLKGVFVCLSIIKPIDFTLGGRIAEDLRKCSVECEAVWMSVSRECFKQLHRRPSNRPVSNRHVLNRHCTGVYKASVDGCIFQ